VLALASHQEPVVHGCATTVRLNLGPATIILLPMFALIRRVDA